MWYMSCFNSGLVIALVVSLIFILLLRFTASVLLWFVIISVITMVAYGVYCLFGIVWLSSFVDFIQADCCV